MVNVVTNENIAQLITTGRVDPFVPPEGDKPEAPKEEAKPEAAVTVETKEAEKPVDEDGDEPGLDENVQKRINARIHKKHAQMKEAEEFAELQYNERKLAEQRADKLEARLKELEAKAQPAPQEVSKPKPKAEDFANVEAYADALTDWKVEQKFAERLKQEEQTKQQAEVERVEREFDARVAAFVKETPNYREVVGASDITLPPYVTQFLKESALGPQLCYHFAQHPDAYEAIGKLSPIKAIAELGKLETKLEKPVAVTPVIKTPDITRAPAPIQPLDTSAAVVNKDPAKMNFQELREYERQRAAAKRRH